jgi:hypothetical protein
MTFRNAFLLILLSGCGDFQDHPGRFTLEMIAPEHYGPVNNVSGNLAYSPPGPVLDCSLSDPFVALTVESHGCSLWTAETTASDSQDRTDSGVTTLSPDRKLLRSAWFPGFYGDFELRAHCNFIFDNPVEIGIRYQAGSKGIDSVDLSQFGEPIEQLLPLPGDGFLAVGRRQTWPLVRDASGNWNLSGGVVVSADGHAHVYLLGDRVVLKDTCDAFACEDERANLLTYEIGSSEVAIGGLPATLQLVGQLGTDRLIFYQPVVQDPSLPPNGQINLVDMKLNPVAQLALPAPAFPAEPELVPGIAGPRGVFYVGRSIRQFYGVLINSTGTAVEQTDLGQFDGAGEPSVRLRPDANAFVYWGPGPDNADGCRLGVRDAQSGVDLWTGAQCVDQSNPPLFIWDKSSWLLVVLTPNQLLGLDAQTGQTRWLLNRQLNGLSVPVTSLRAFRDTVLVTTDVVEPVVKVIGADGKERLSVPITADSMTAGFVATSDGLLLGVQDRTLYVVHAADDRLNAPPHICTFVDCGQGSVDLASDPQNCGDCKKACQPDEQCLSGSCTALPSL